MRSTLEKKAKQLLVCNEDMPQDIVAKEIACMCKLVFLQFVKEHFKGYSPIKLGEEFDKFIEHNYSL